MAPRLTNHPGRVALPAPALGADNRLIYGGELGLDDSRLAALREAGHI